MTAAEFKKKWSRYQGKETSAYQGHFDDLCRLLGQPTPAEADPSGADFFCFQKRVVKDAEFFDLHETPDASEPNERGFARFLNRIVFCFFAEDTGLLPRKLFSELLKTHLDDPHHFAETLENLFKVMARGGTFGKDKIRHFNGHLFEDSTVFELTPEEAGKLADAAEADWQFIQPSIMGTLFQRALDESQRAALGAQYTGEPDIRDLVEPVLMAPLKSELVGDDVRSLFGGVEVTRLKSTGSKKSGTPYVGSYKARIAAFLKKRTLTNLYNERPAWLDLAHKKLDAAVAAAYGWVRAARANEPEQPEADLTDEQILERLLALNLERAAEEARSAKVKKPKTSREKHTDEML